MLSIGKRHQKHCSKDLRRPACHATRQRSARIGLEHLRKLNHSPNDASRDGIPGVSSGSVPLFTQTTGCFEQCGTREFLKRCYNVEGGAGRVARLIQ